MKRIASSGLLFAAALIHANADAQTCVPSHNTRCNVIQELDLIDGIQDSTYHYTFNGAGVDIYIIDQGFNPPNTNFQAEFGNRYTAASGYTPPTNSDSGGHGYNMAKAAAGATWGVATGANIKQLRVNVSNGDPSNTWLKAALTWLREEKKKLDQPNGHLLTQLRKQSVVSISLVRDNDPAINALIKEVVDLGLPVFVSAGNSGLNGGGDGQYACGYSPAGATEAFTVSAGSVPIVGQPGTGGREFYANYGGCVDGFVYAPHTEFGGTSEATARAAGVAALIWQQNTMLSGKQVVTEMIARAQADLMPLESYDDSANRVVTSVPPAKNPSFFGIRNGLCGGQNTLQWNDSGPEILYYQLEKGTNPQISQPVRHYEGLNQAHTVSVGVTTYFRVRGCNYRGCSSLVETYANRAAISSPPCQ